MSTWSMVKRTGHTKDPNSPVVFQYRLIPHIYPTDSKQGICICSVSLNALIYLFPRRSRSEKPNLFSIVPFAYHRQNRIYMICIYVYAC